MSMPIANVGDWGQGFNAVVILGREPAPAGELIRGSIPFHSGNSPNGAERTGRTAMTAAIIPYRPNA
ncbi:hypothetical protein [Mesorhizobium sp. 1B3]|uniref:hypothetical protein n=1 Tax=Mesorhizobium sp. 1B3 TaxID=3243599 RepID=UPI003D95CB9B